MPAESRSDCREADCPNKALKGAWYCPEHIDEVRQCKVRRKTDNARCRKTAVRGLDVCVRHGGKLTAQKAVARRSAVLTEMQRFVRPFTGDVDPISVFEAEFRRTLGRIRWYDEQLAALGSAQDLVWGLTEEKRVNASEYPGTDRTYAAKVNMFEELQRWERKHLLDLENIWIKANLDERKLQIMRTQVDRTYAQVVRALEKLGLDPLDEKVRDALAEAILEPMNEDGALLALRHE